MWTAKIKQIGTLCSLLLLLPYGSPAQAQVCNGSWTFDDDGWGAYRVEVLAPRTVQLDARARANPTLLLEVGRRYEIQVVHYTAYPLEVIAKGTSVEQDKVLLAMGPDAGSFASDPGVNWQDDGQGTVQFTLTARLFRAMADGGRTPGYRCRTQAATMRGDFAVTWTPPVIERIAHTPIRMDFNETTTGLVAPSVPQSDRLSGANGWTRQMEG